MRLGVLSDTHDNLGNISRAVELFAAHGVEALVHAGDFCSPFVFRELAPLRAQVSQMFAVFGNNDGDRLLLANKGAGFCTFSDAVTTVTVSDRNIALMHYPDVAQAVHDSGQFDLVVFGHTHEAVVSGGAKILLNPGACSGYLAARSTIAIVDLETMHVELLEIG